MDLPSRFKLELDEVGDRGTPNRMSHEEKGHLRVSTKILRGFKGTCVKIGLEGTKYAALEM